MMPRYLAGTLGGALFFAICGRAEPLTLDRAVRIALESNQALAATEASVRQAKAGLDVAGSRRFPRLSYDESYTRSNNPVFVFGSLLNQRRFTEQNFALDRLNNPDSLQNFRSLVEVRQTLYDFGRTSHGMAAARATADLSLEDQRSRRSGTILSVVEAYFQVVLSAQRVEVSDDALDTALADLKRAESLVEDGMATRADVLAARVHVSAVREESIKASHGEKIAWAALNQVLDLDQETRFDLVTPLTAPTLTARSLQDYLKRAVRMKPESRSVELTVELAEHEVGRAKSELWPTLDFQAGVEADRGCFLSRGGGNWLAAVSLHWDIWDGSAKRARVAEASHARDRAAALARDAQSQIELGVRQAFLELASAEERVAVAAAAVDEAQEGHRIIENRYEAGLENITELIRSQLAVNQSRLRHLQALYDQRIASAVLEDATGELTPVSEALR